ncbi:MAG: hypothetical protein OEY38_01185 [Gammaproteobacteria bacterium]|nr:hypothetical protein [Gammaproteobacteria bacterium]
MTRNKDRVSWDESVDQSADALLKQYQQQSQESPPPALDHLILQHAQQASHQNKEKHFAPNRYKWFSTAAVMVLGIGLVTLMQQQSPQEMDFEPMDLREIPLSTPVPDIAPSTEIVEEDAALEQEFFDKEAQKRSLTPHRQSEPATTKSQITLEKKSVPAKQKREVFTREKSSSRSIESSAPASIMMDEALSIPEQAMSGLERLERKPNLIQGVFKVSALDKLVANPSKREINGVNIIYSWRIQDQKLFLDLSIKASQSQDLRLRLQLKAEENAVAVKVDTKKLNLIAKRSKKLSWLIDGLPLFADQIYYELSW